MFDCDVFQPWTTALTGLLSRGRKVLAQFGTDRPLTDADLRYLHQTHGLPPDLVTELLDEQIQPGLTGR